MGEKVVCLYAMVMPPLLTSHLLPKSTSIWPQHPVHAHPFENGLTVTISWVELDLFSYEILPPKSLSDGLFFSITSAIILIYLIWLTFLGLSFLTSFPELVLAFFNPYSSLIFLKVNLSMTFQLLLKILQ